VVFPTTFWWELGKLMVHQARASAGGQMADSHRDTTVGELKRQRFCTPHLRSAVPRRSRESRALRGQVSTKRKSIYLWQYSASTTGDVADAGASGLRKSVRTIHWPFPRAHSGERHGRTLLKWQRIWPYWKVWTRRPALVTSRVSTFSDASQSFTRSERINRKNRRAPWYYRRTPA
jgi:hypothetical protein